MDKKNTIIGVLLLVAAFGLLIFGARTSPRPPPAPEVGKPVTVVTPTAGANQAPGPLTGALPAVTPDNAAFAAVAATDASAKTITLANDYIEARFVDLGGAIEGVALKKYPAEKGKSDPFVFNRLHADPMLAFSQDTFPGLGRTVRYDVVSQTANEVVFRTVFENRIEVTRRYTLAPSNPGPGQGDPYQLRHEIIFKNLKEETITPLHFALNLGTGAPTNAADYGVHLSTGYNDGKNIEFINRSKLEGGGLLAFVGAAPKGPIPSIETPVSLVWAAVEDQFFVSILTPDTPGNRLVTRRVELPPAQKESRPLIGVTGTAGFDLPAIAPQGEAKLAMSLYVGPKEYTRLSNGDVFKQDQDKVMQFGWFKFFSALLLTMMTWVHGWVGNWGLAIIITTLTLKVVFLPLTLAASKSSKRMQKIQPEMKALREKYKDNPQKMNQATMELFKEHKVNPAGGCLPILITIPFFFGFYRMLGSTAELRFAEFLWAKDLSAPDTVLRIFDLPLNIMPLLLGATMVLQMHFTPQPTVDNSQQKIFKFMPYMFTLFCYNLSCALSLYSTVNGLFTIAQQMIINRMKDDGDPAAAKPAVASGGPRGSMKNVTPGKKKVK